MSIYYVRLFLNTILATLSFINGERSHTATNRKPPTGRGNEQVVFTISDLTPPNCNCTQLYLIYLLKYLDSIPNAAAYVYTTYIQTN